jgi:integrase
VRQKGDAKNVDFGGNYHVDVPAHVGAILDQNAATLRPDHPWLFQTSTGSPFSHEAVQKEFKRVLGKAWPKETDDEPDPPQWSIAPHGMRHIFATLHILAGKPAAWVSRQLGHKDVTVTLKVYAWAFEMLDETAADEHGARLFGNELATPTSSTDAEPAPVLH